MKKSIQHMNKISVKIQKWREKQQNEILEIKNTKSQIKRSREKITNQTDPVEDIVTALKGKIHGL